MGVGKYVDTRESMSTTLLECLDRYASEVVPNKKGADRDMYRVNMWRRDNLASKGIGAIRQVDVAKWRDARIASGIAPSTVTKDLTLLSHIFTIAAKEWRFPITKPVLSIHKPKVRNSRDRLPTNTLNLLPLRLLNFPPLQRQQHRPRHLPSTRTMSTHSSRRQTQCPSRLGQTQAMF